MKKKSVLFGMFLLICCLWISSCKQEEVVIEQPSLEKSEKEETDKADGKEEKSSQESEPEAETIWSLYSFHLPRSDRWWQYPFLPEYSEP